MKTKLVEFSLNNHLVRGILTLPDDEIKKRVICLHGFERCSSTESKFKKLTDTLLNHNTAVLRLDFSGCGLSDGDFKCTTVESQGIEFLHAINEFDNQVKYGKISIIAHSLGACVVAATMKSITVPLEKIVLIAPALNQKDLLRYWFTTSNMKKIDPSIEITWQNYKKYLSEEEFLIDCNRIDQTAKANFIDSTYFIQNKDIDYSLMLNGNDPRILHVHGTNDVAAPIENLNISFKNQILIENGDHDLEIPAHMKIWTEKVIDFLIN